MKRYLYAKIMMNEIVEHRFYHDISAVVKRLAEELGLAYSSIEMDIQDGHVWAGPDGAYFQVLETEVF